MKRTTISLYIFILLSTGLVAQSVNLQLKDYRICNNQIAVDLFVSASAFTTDTFSIGSSSIFLNYDGEKIRFHSYTATAFDPEVSERALNANWEEQQYDYNDEYGIFHLVLQKNDGGIDNYTLRRDTTPIQIGTLLFDYREGGSMHDIAVNFPFTTFNDDLANDGSNTIQLENAASLSIMNDTILWYETFQDLEEGATMDSTETSWSVDSSATLPKANPNFFIGIERGAIKFRTLNGEAVWTTDWINLCDNAVNISVDAKENGTMEDDDYIRFYYQTFTIEDSATIDGPEVMFGEIVGESPENNTYITLTTDNKITGDMFRVIVKVKNGGNGNFENHYFDNLRLSTSDCFQQVRPELDGITDDVANIRWNPDFKATSYQVLYRISGETTWDPALSNDVFSLISTSPEDSIKNLLANTTYEFQVRSVCDSITAPFSEVQTFRTNNCPNFDNNLIGQSCNDGNNNTINDVYTTSCVCRGQAVLPVELQYFYANAQGSNVYLNWSTLSELNNQLFTVERSKYGTSWVTVTHMDGAGTSREELFYEAVDSFPITGTSYYRLKQTDFDGHVSYSDIQTVTINADAQANIQVFPNPTSGRIFFSQTIEGSFELFDAFGVLIRSGALTESALDISELPNGVYLLSLHTDQKRIVKRILKR